MADLRRARPRGRRADAQVSAALGFVGGHVDVYQVHNLLAVEKRLTQLERLKASGAVRVIGVTHYVAGLAEGVR